MVKKTKGLSVVAPSTNEKFKFKNDGTSKLGDSEGDVHEIKGELDAEGVVEVEGEVVLQDRLSGVLFSPPHIDASVEAEMIQHFVDHAAAEYEGFMIYVTNAAPTPPFNISNKFYFCEAGIWHSSPFDSQVVNVPPNLNPTYTVSVPALGTEDEPFSLDLPSDLFQDADGDELTYSAVITGGDSLPAWLSFDATNTILSGTPTEADVGLLNLTITASDPFDQTASTTQEIQILVKPMPFWAGASIDGYGNDYYPVENVLSTTENGDLIIDPYFNGEYLIIAPDVVDLTAGPIEIDLEFDGPLTDGMGIRWGSAGGSVAINWLMLGLYGEGTSNQHSWLGAAFGQDEEGNGGIYTNDSAYLQVRALKEPGEDEPKVATTNSSIPVTYYHRDPPQRPWQSPSDRMVQVPDLEFKIVIDAYRTQAIVHPDNANIGTSIDVTVVGRPKNIPQSAVDDGFGNVTLNDLLDRDFYNTIPLKYQTVFFHRTNQSFQLQGHSKGPISDSDFRPFAFFNGGNHTQSPYSPNHAAVAPIITSWQQTTYQAPEPATQITVVQDMPAGITTTFDMSGLFNNPIDYSKTRSWIDHGTKLLFSAELSDGSPLPDWMAVDTESEVLAMNPPLDAVGNPYIINFTAMNSLGMTGSNSVSFQVAQAQSLTEETPLLPIFDDLDGGKFVSPGAGRLQGDGLGQGNALASAVGSSIDMLEHISPGDISKALVLEWSFSEDNAPYGVGNGIGYYGDFFHAVLRNADNNSEYFQMTKFKSQYDDMFYGKHSGNNNSTGYNYVENFVPSEWEYRLIVRPAEWWESGNLKKIAYAIATRKKDSSYTWDDVMNISEFGTFLPNQNSAYTEALIDWRMNYSVGDLDSFRLYPQLGSHDNSSHDGHWEDIKMFITELDPPVAPVFNSNYNLSLSAIIDQGAWSYQLPSDTFTDANAYETLTYSAEMADGNPLPAWLSFDPATRTFSGTPQSSDLGTLSIRVTVTDSDSLTADTMVTLDVAYPTMFADPDVGGYDIVQFLSAHNGDAIGSSMLQGQDGPVTMVAADGTSPQWVTPNVTPPPGKKLVVKWEYDTLDDGNIIAPSGGNMSVSTYDGNGWSWKYFQIHSGPEAYYRFAGSGYAYPTSVQGVDLYSSQFRMETTFDETNGSRSTIMKIRPVGSAVDFNSMTAADHGNNGCYYMESSHTADAASGDLDADSDGWRDTKINISAHPTASDSSGSFIKFKYLRYEIVDE